ncbi:MAG: YfcC family protein [Eggerthellaceae bacterium]|nr:YfcC family protein [Eggerthellaceae bacterium]
MVEETKTQEKDRKKRSISSFTILVIMLLALALITIVVSMAGGTGVSGATLYDVTTAPVKGFTDALPVCLFVMILGGFLGIVTETGALDAGITALVKKLNGNELILIPILMFIFSIGGTTYGMCEETVPFYLLLAATMIAAGFDSMVGAATVLLGAGCGVLGSTVNPFAVGAAVDALSGSGIEVNQGFIIILGVVLWLSTLAISIFFVMRYAKKVKNDKGSTILTLQEQETMAEEFGGEQNQDEDNDGSFVDAKGKKRYMTGRQKGTLIVFGLAFLVMIIGFVPWEDFGVGVFNAGAATSEVVSAVDGAEVATEWNDAGVNGTLAIEGDISATVTNEVEESLGWSSWLTSLPLGQWYFDEASTWFLLMALVIGFIGGLTESRFVKAFIAGAADMMGVVLIIALARSITVLMDTTGMSGWILENAANFLQGVSAIVFAPLSFLLYIVLSFLIPSSSGMATVTMPIMGPLAERLGFSVETMIMIFSAGNGLVNLFTPTSGAIMGGLTLAKIEYSTWLKFGAKLFVVLGIVCAVILTGAMLLL